MSDAGAVPPELSAVASEWRAEEAQVAAAAAKKVQALEPEAPPAPAVPAELQQLSAVAWTIVDRLVVAQLGAAWATTEAEREQLAGPTAALLHKHMPDVLTRLTTTPEGVFLGTVALVYAPKALAQLTAPPPAAQPEPAPAPEASA